MHPTDNVVVFQAYRSHKLLKEMEEKELKFKQLQRMKELAMKHKTVDKRDSTSECSFEQRRESSQFPSTFGNTMSMLPGKISQMTSARRSFAEIHSANKAFKIDEAGDYEIETNYVHRNTHNQLKVLEINKVGRDPNVVDIEFKTSSSAREKSSKKKIKNKQYKIISGLAERKEIKKDK